MKTTVWIWGLAGALLIVLATMASAQTIYENDLIQADNYGFVSNSDGDLSADNFEITGNYQIESITWYGMYDSDDASITDTFDIKMYDSSQNLLYQALGITSVIKTGLNLTDSNGQTIYSYSFDVSSFGWELSNGEYLISISNENSEYSDWYWADGQGGDGITYYLNSGTWDTETYNVDLAFSLDGEPVQTGTVPEPGTMLLFGLGLLVTTFYRRAGGHGLYS